MYRICALSMVMLMAFPSAKAQVKSVDQLDHNQLNWYNLDPLKDGVMGTSVDKAYQELLIGKVPRKIIVIAVIDSGVDIDHEDLKGQIWVNEDEVAGNQVDDDNNGYVDDVHGWNFIGGKDGRNVTYESYEYTRIVNSGGGPLYAKAKKLYDEELAKQKEEQAQIARFIELYSAAKAAIKEQSGVDVSNKEDLAKVQPGGDRLEAARRFLASRYDRGFKESMLPGIKGENENYFKYFLNMSFNPRTIVGDDPNNLDGRTYGNPDVRGPRSDHGSGVAGVIAGVRDNQVGINGITSSSVKIMCLRTTPRGDERDKDVAMAIRYAVDNGANIINMSFGKRLSPQKAFVDEAVRLAESKGVLIVHGAGNEASDIDDTERFPSDRYLDGNEPANWLEVGSSTKKNNEEIASFFSNYGANHVDLFAPGTDLIVADSSSTYNMHSGTSLSAPVVTGIAALVLSYYPDLNPQQMISLLMESSVKIEGKVLIPARGERTKKSKFTNLCRSGGVVNAYEALKRAEAMK